MGRIMRVTHNLKKAEQSFVMMAGKVDKMESNWEDMPTKLDSIASKSVA